MSEGDRPPPRVDVPNRTGRDVARFRRRETSRTFWRSFALIGSVGWPIVLLSTGGALLGQYLDRRLHTGIRLTLTLVTVGAALGSAIAYRSLREHRS